MATRGQIHHNSLVKREYILLIKYLNKRQKVLSKQVLLPDEVLVPAIARMYKGISFTRI